MYDEKDLRYTFAGPTPFVLNNKICLNQAMVNIMAKHFYASHSTIYLACDYSWDISHRLLKS